MNPYISDMRSMRERMRAALRKGMIAVLDVGSSKTACFVLEVDLARLDKAAGTAAHDVFGAVRVVGVGVTRSRGVRLGEIVDLDEAEKAIRTALEMAEKMAGARVDQVVAAVSGARPQSASCYGEAAVEYDEVTVRDLSRALSNCDWPERRAGREVIHALPVNYALDDGAPVADPRGMAAENLIVDLHTISVSTTALKNLSTCVKRCDLELAGVVAAPYAAALSSLVEDEKKLGAACIDLGAGVTNVSIFLRNQMIYAGSVRVGGDHVTQDISAGLYMPEQAAERIKTLHGGAVSTGLDNRDLIEAPHIAHDHPADRRNISRSELIGVIRPRLEEILEKARRKLDEGGFSELPGSRIVLTGGGAQLTGVEEVAQRILGRQVRIGRPLRIGGLPEATTGPGFAAAVGLAIYAVRQQDELWDFEQVGALGGRRRIGAAFRWFRDHW
ncbi:MAG: cell division protein FtsA [Pikeienuella sp.]